MRFRPATYISMYFDYTRLWGWIKKAATWIFDKLFSGSGEGSGGEIGDIFKVNLIGWKNRFGDQVVGSGYIDRSEKFQLVHQGIDPRDLEKYLTLLEDFDDREAKETQILDWYYSQEIDIQLKESLLVIISKLPEIIEYNLTFTPESQGDTNQTTPKPLAEAIAEIKTLLKEYRFDELDSAISKHLVQFEALADKVHLLSEIGALYEIFRDFEKAVHYYLSAYDLQPGADLAKTIGKLAMQNNQFSIAKDIINKELNTNDTLSRESEIELKQILATALIRLNEYPNAEDLLIEARSIVDTDYENLRQYLQPIYDELVNIQFRVGHAQRVEEYLLRGISESHKVDQIDLRTLYDKQEYKEYFRRLGGYFGILNEWDTSQKYFHAALQNASEVNASEYDFRDFFSHIFNLTIAYLYNGQYDKCEVSLKEAVTFLFRALPKSPSLVTATHLVYGLLELMRDDVTEANFHLNIVFDSIDTVEQFGPSMKGFVYAHLGNIYRKKKEYVRAKLYYQKAIEALLPIHTEESPKIQQIKEVMATIEVTDIDVIVIF